MHRMFDGEWLDEVVITAYRDGEGGTMAPWRSIPIRPASSSAQVPAATTSMLIPSECYWRGIEWFGVTGICFLLIGLRSNNTRADRLRRYDGQIESELSHM
jgi:hypothetical protein